MGTDQLKTEVTGAIGWLTFDNPGRHNAISMAMAEHLPVAIAEFEADDRVRVVILSGSGEKAFAAGSDISGFGESRANPEANRRYNAIHERAYDAVYHCRKPTIAMIRGYCIGGGLDFAASCDVRIAAEDASFSAPAGKLGLGYGYESVVRLKRVLGAPAARELLVSARRMNAEEAFRVGLLHRVVPVADLRAATVAYADTLAANAPLTLAAIKRSLVELEREIDVRDPAAAQKLIDACFASEDYDEGRKAFAEKRKPQFKGQ
ncbi:MAG: Enoyl-CoA hydratase/isomerase [Betaproteobacteria bacterium]|nr:Enoyl-CoA hydratase/isomerase [Betaproteobacteria bacterium]